MGIFQKLFAGKEAQFQRRVLSVLKGRYPSESFRAAADARTILVGNVSMDLSSIADLCEKNELQADELISQYFSHAVALTRRADRISWEEAQGLLRPQLFPAEYQKSIPVLSFPFVQNLSVGILLKTEKLPFVYSNQSPEWNVSPEQILQRSIENLANDAVETEVTISGSDRFIGLETHDGFDAARILLPKIRKLAAEKLGEPYNVGIPNQSFLILWAKNCSQRFQDYAIEKIETDYSIQPFPLKKTPLESGVLR